ncbi:hypothetical protein B0A69_21445 [Chryseobacterium shigense]|uniref:DUF4397 domain-containing protein n=1 Tax=Chryseobacterium shigense TaxID=297244 RepID=A0A1N7IJ30_9FLAO|nr:hypothetical protein [Chryseobacterium shigense]PQA89988.1 hypothetical protein B0A69_21445 [Chryseobacterium shigense]SIS37095.1 hypothetical protein SAMN05421639_10418 [Chryseobacterium shigense]
MKKIQHTIPLFLACFSFMNAQVGVGISTPNPNAQLDITSSSKGFLLPRVALTATNNPSPLTAHVEGMMVYNTATNTSVAANPVYPGEYYNDGTQWQRKSALNDVRMITGGTITDLLSSTPIDIAAGTPTTTTLSTFSFTLDRPSSVEFSGNISMSFNVNGDSNTPVGDAAIKLVTANFVFTTAPGGIALNSPFGDSTITYMNAVTANITTIIGNFYTAPHATLLLPAGNYVVNLNGLASSSNAFRVTYGSGVRDMVQIKATPTK